MGTADRVRPLRPADPSALGGYRLLGRIGEGGMGVVYLAQRGDGTRAAIKAIHAHLVANPEFVGRFRSEAERVRQVPAFATAALLDVDLRHDPPYLVVEYVDGPSLAEAVARSGPLEGAALLALASGVARGLAGIHAAGVIHRDLKPANVLLAPDHPRIIDFGIARPFEATSQHTRTDMTVGTVSYMAPERFTDDPDSPVTAAADVFAWGCLVAYAATGRTPFRGDSPQATVARILSQPPQLDGLPSPLREAVSLALAREPADRPTARQLHARLAGRVGEDSSRDAGSPVAEPPAVRRRRAQRALLAGLLVLSGAVVLELVVLQARDGNSSVSQGAAATWIPVPEAVTAGVASSHATAASVRPVPSMTTSGTARATAPRSDRPSPPGASTPAPVGQPGRNLALNRPATASSEEGAWLSAAKAVDGDAESRWGSEFSDPQWLMVDLGAGYRLREIRLRWQAAYATDYRVEVSTDAATWTTIYQTSAGTGGEVVVPADGASGRYVRVYGTRRTGNYGYSLFEIDVR